MAADRVTQRVDTISFGEAGSMDLHVWTPAIVPAPAVLLVQEIFGVGPYIRSVAERLAEAGYVVGAPDIFWRFHPGWVAEATPEGTQASIGKVAELDVNQAIDDCGAALTHLAGLDDVEGVPAVLGFCLGGTIAYGVAARFEPSACVSYYGSGVPALLDQLASVTCPTLFHFGSADPYIPGASIEALAEAAAAFPHMAVNVEIAGHAFDNPAPMYHDEAAARAAWSKTMAFLSQHLPVRSG